MGIDAIIAIAGLLAPPVVDFVKKKWLKKENDTPEATMSTLATTKPEVLPGYLEATVSYLRAQIEYFNRDVTGTPAQWVVNTRAIIRPAGVVFAALILTGMVTASFMGYAPPAEVSDTVTGVRLSCELIISSWFGTRISING
jgi:hypothetical protein